MLKASQQTVYVPYIVYLVFTGTRCALTSFKITFSQRPLPLLNTTLTIVDFDFSSGNGINSNKEYMHTLLD